MRAFLQVIKGPGLGRKSHAAGRAVAVRGADRLGRRQFSRKTRKMSSVHFLHPMAGQRVPVQGSELGQRQLSAMTSGSADTLVYNGDEHPCRPGDFPRRGPGRRGRRRTQFASHSASRYTATNSVTHPSIPPAAAVMTPRSAKHAANFPTPAEPKS